MEYGIKQLLPTLRRLLGNGKTKQIYKNEESWIRTVRDARHIIGEEQYRKEVQICLDKPISLENWERISLLGRKGQKKKNMIDAGKSFNEKNYQEHCYFDYSYLEVNTPETTLTIPSIPSIPENAYTTESPFDSIRRQDENGNEYWTARELKPLLGYTGRFDKFESVIQKARDAIVSSGELESSHISPLELTRQILHLEYLAGRTQGGGNAPIDYKLSRHACYLIAMNGDSSKPEIGLAQTYFSRKTREAELRSHQQQIEPNNPVMFVQQTNYIIEPVLKTMYTLVDTITSELRELKQEVVELRRSHNNSDNSGFSTKTKELTLQDCYETTKRLNRINHLKYKIGHCPISGKEIIRIKNGRLEKINGEAEYDHYADNSSSDRDHTIENCILIHKTINMRKKGDSKTPLNKAEKSDLSLYKAVLDSVRIERESKQPSQQSLF